MVRFDIFDSILVIFWYLIPNIYQLLIYDICVSEVKMTTTCENLSISIVYGVENLSYTVKMSVKNVAISRQGQETMSRKLSIRSNASYYKNSRQIC